ncbi:MAG TPA: Ppx/GppA phosphatase family protein [Pseudonocardia sp.]|nr:Ppx/GppA phosphatase family protein [Pseudonocardia sp.]
MRLGVLDVGSNTVHLLVVDAHRGGQPTPQHDDRWLLRLAEHVGDDDVLSREGEKALVKAVRKACEQAEKLGCEEVLALVTSAIREARNGMEVLERVRRQTGVELQVTSGEQEARLTFLAVRRWYGWSAGRLLVLDIGGGSLELAAGLDELPDVAASLPLGAARLTREWFRSDPPSRRELDALREHLDAQLAPVARELRRAGSPDLAVGTSKTFRSLARLTGAAPSGAGPRVRRGLTDTGLRQLSAFVTRMSSADLAELEGVSPSRAHQLAAGALVAEAAMRALRVPQLEICPWALREGVILRRLDTLDGTAQIDRSAQDAPDGLGRLTSYEARCTG